MCTAITFKTNHFYVGRNLDFDFAYGQKVLITPSGFPLSFTHENSLATHYAIIGMGIIGNDYPLYFDAMNDQGLAIAGLNFVGNACYHPYKQGKVNLPNHELIPYILGTCKDMTEARQLLDKLNITDESQTPGAQKGSLHWILADKNECVVIESMKDGLHIHENPIGVLTNNPPFDMQMLMFSQYMNLSEKDPVPYFGETRYSRGMGSIGLPGDLSSTGRFAKCAFTKLHSRTQETDTACVSQFFHILHSVEQQDGCCEVNPGFYEITQYTDCMDTTSGILYYTTYNNSRINAVNMHACDLNSRNLITFDLEDQTDIHYQN